MVAVIGPGWLEELAQVEDFVAQELGFALRRGIPIVPVLVGGSVMPDPHVLPQPLRGVVAFQAMEIDSGREFRRQVLELAGSLRQLHTQRLEQAAKAAREAAERERAQHEAAEQARAAKALPPSRKQAELERLTRAAVERAQRLSRRTLLGGALALAVLVAIAAFYSWQLAREREAAAKLTAEHQAEAAAVAAKLDEMQKQFQEQGGRMLRLQNELNQQRDEATRLGLERELQKAADQRARLKQQAGAVRNAAYAGGGQAVGGAKPCNCPPGDPLCSCL